MKRYLPFLIILVVALLAAGGGTWLYRAKMRAQPPIVRAVPTPGEEANSLHAEGPADAPVILEIYGDFQCPPCATATMVVAELQKEYGKQLRVIFHEFPLAMHAHALEAAMTAEAAGLQGHFWPMHDMLYKYQEVWSKASDPAHFFKAYAASMGLDAERFARDMQSPDLRDRIKEDGETGAARGVRNTPTIFVNGSEFRGIFLKENLQAAIDAALAAKKNA